MALPQIREFGLNMIKRSMFSAATWYTNYSMEIILFVSNYLSAEIIMLAFITL